MSILERVRSVTSKHHRNSCDPRFSEFLDNNGNSSFGAPLNDEKEANQTKDKCTLFALKASYYSRKGLQVDKTSRIVFPVLFLLFNAFYWWFYIMRETREDPTIEQNLPPNNGG